ncbi:hypothetical protein CDO44_06460 [Pigmentiphaga sp. NML080357]|uniref:hypothetical protein n=1 Tax=Pigmentiphaga sp. NML080357 TaxID=2008675 RepID=UPI000B420B96|nr:hypothetical protein [Pigmentiphaga sp. NML080357]OVZ61275.1 hypothetical protein CDO44_06460 [Pigmentiphaga sp. NML080357]
MNQPAFSDSGAAGLFDAGHAPGTIGADPDLRRRIESALAELGKAREARFGYAAYGAVVAALKRDFAIASYLPWTEIWNWPAERADEIINYLHGRHAETLGRPSAGAQRRA